MKKEVLNTVFGSCPVNMSDEDILDAMKSIPGYLDITPGDFKEIFNYAYGYAIERIAQSPQAKDIMTSPAQTVFEDTPITDLVMIIGSFGASAVLIYGVIRSPPGAAAKPDRGPCHFSGYRRHHLQTATCPFMAGSTDCGRHFHRSYACHQNPASPGRRYRFDCRYRQSENSQSGIFLCVYPRRRWSCHHAGCGTDSEQHSQKSPIP